MLINFTIDYSLFTKKFFVILKDRKFQVTKINVGYKKDCFETEIGEKYFNDNRYKSWKKVGKGKEKSEA